MSAKKYTRRDFLRTASISAAAVGVGALAGCTTGAPAPAQATTAPAAAAAATTAAATAPTTAPAPAQAGRDINVVGIYPLTGVIASDGAEMRNGNKMAVDEINDMGGLVGHKLKFIEVDDKDSLTADEVTNAFRRAIDVEKADVIFSGYHLLSAPEFDICADAGVLYYNNNTQKAWTDKYQSNPDQVLVDLPDGPERGVVRRRLRPLSQLHRRERRVQAEEQDASPSSTATRPTAPSSATPSTTRSSNSAGTWC